MTPTTPDTMIATIVDHLRSIDDAHDGRIDLAATADREVRRMLPLDSRAEQRRVARAAVARLTGLGQLEELVDDPTVDEVLVNAAGDIWVDRAGRLHRAGHLVGQPLEHLVERILAPIGRRLDSSSPVVDARLADGSRVCAVVPPVGVDGPSLSIRRFARVVRPLTEFIDGVGVAVLREVLGARCNVVVSGATSSGKTSLLASLLRHLPAEERLVVLEDTAELPLDNDHAVRLEARPASPDGPPPIELTDLVRTALRLRPDRLVIGEVRGAEVVGLVQAMNTGHDGSWSTCHANGAVDALIRLETLVLQSAPAWPLAAVRRQLLRSVDVVIHVARGGPDGRRRIESIVEVVDDGVAADVGELPTVRPLVDVDADGHVSRLTELRRARC